MKGSILTIVALGALVSASPAQAQRRSGQRRIPHTEGFLIGATTMAASGITIRGPNVDAITTDLGEGGGLQVGYGFNERLSAWVSADITKQGTNYGGAEGNMGLAHVEVSGRYAFPKPGARLVPYITALAGSRGLAARLGGEGISGEIHFKGHVFGAGGGILYAVGNSVDMDVQATAATGSLNNFELTGDIERSGDLEVDRSTNFRLKLGFNWHPSSR
jgi:hypothetical protein